MTKKQIRLKHSVLVIESCQACPMYHIDTYEGGLEDATCQGGLLTKTGPILPRNDASEFCPLEDYTGPGD